MNGPSAYKPISTDEGSIKGVGGNKMVSKANIVGKEYRTRFFILKPK